MQGSNIIYKLYKTLFLFVTFRKWPNKSTPQNGRKIKKKTKTVQRMVEFFFYLHQ
uniref:Uncharacterized protein n=1 Tax=Solanum lycopersicum TaxID=4081 RepID=A0A3Q7EXX6_SOLLC